MKQELEPIETIWMKKQKIMKHSIPTLKKDDLFNVISPLII